LKPTAAASGQTLQTAQRNLTLARGSVSPFHDKQSWNAFKSSQNGKIK